MKSSFFSTCYISYNSPLGILSTQLNPSPSSSHLGLLAFASLCPHSLLPPSPPPPFPSSVHSLFDWLCTCFGSTWLAKLKNAESCICFREVFFLFSYFWPSSGTENNPLLDEWSRGVTRGLRGKPNKNAWSTRIYAQAHGERERWRERGEQEGKRE